MLSVLLAIRSANATDSTSVEAIADDRAVMTGYSRPSIAVIYGPGTVLPFDNFSRKYLKPNVIHALTVAVHLPSSWWGLHQLTTKRRWATT